ncbi:RuBisCO accumulation factor 1 [Trichothermofontia sp.]
MTAMPPNPSPQPAIDAEQLFLQLRQKQGNWVAWGQACQQLQKAGYSPQQIFEATGFEPVHQNQVIVAAQVYTSIVNAPASEAVIAHYAKTGSDRLYELRILTQAERVAAAELILAKQLDADQAHELAKIYKEVARSRQRPPEFSDQPGDVMAYHYWKLARQTSDLADRSRLIAQGLGFVATPAARQQLEQLLTDFTVTPKHPQPLLPLYRLEAEEEMPRVVPVVGRLPLHPNDLKAVPLLDEQGGFRLVTFQGEGVWVAVPGWQGVVTAEDPIALLATPDHLPLPPTVTIASEIELLVICDRAQRQWDPHSYFLLAQDNQIQVQWQDAAPSQPILGRVLLVLRPKAASNEPLTEDPWQIDE